MKIDFVKAKKVKNSRGEDTLEVEISAGNFSAVASVPSGKSRGSKEAVAVNVDLAIKNTNDIIASKIIGKEVTISEIDKLLLELDGTDNKSNLGANTILGVSIATLKLSAKIANQPLWKYVQSFSTWEPSFQVEFPRLFANVLNGGEHGDFRLPFQEYMFVLGNGSSVIEPFSQLQNLFEKLGEILREKYGDVQMGDEGGYSPKIQTIEEPFEILNHLVVGLPSDLLGSPTTKWGMAMDVAANEFYKNDNDNSSEAETSSGENGYYEILGKKHSSEELLETYENLVEKYPIVSIEDPFAENDFDGFAKITEKLGNKILVVGDDLTVTNPKIIKKAILEKLVNAVIIKPNQIGTVTETLEVIKIAHEAGLKIIVSHRSGETMDSFISDLAIGVGAYGIKTGAPSQPERLIKYERLLEIEKEVIKQ